MTNSDWAQHILKGNKKRLDTDWDDLRHQLWDERRHLNSDNLKELIYQAKVLRARQGGLPVPVRDEQPVMGAIGPCAPDKPPAGPHAEHNRFCTEATPCGECKAILDKPDTSAELGPCESWTSDKPPAAPDEGFKELFAHLCHHNPLAAYDGSTGKRPLGGGK